ncbi:hypothetical protein C8F04DRAFT_1230088 [Mycena alexandri]|uniref:DUF6534 domain-containing protein n=1 Tax=Mycena alexandri TaxID=1745969 RepID=A0AAD6TAC6_9AGAR|nr:hypothetical protein C8F04DRAFT_1230088 [Mycena alexandri]
MSNSNLGALEIGALLSFSLFGVTTTQAHTYYSRFPNDSRNLKLLVAFVWSLEVAHGICIGQTLYETIPNYIHLDGSKASSHFEYTAFRKARTSPSSTVSCSCLGLALYIFLLAYWGPRSPTVIEFENQSAWVLYTNWSVSVANDVIVAATLSYWLHRQRKGVDIRPVSSTVALIDKIIKWSLESHYHPHLGFFRNDAGQLYGECKIGEYTTNPAYVDIWIAVYLVQARLYSNSFLASLNSRTTLRAMNEFSLPLSIAALQVDAPEDVGISKAQAQVLL